LDFYSVAKELGTLQDYKDLSQAAHALGMKVVLDFAPNHVSPGHPWVEALPNNRWFHGSKQKHLKAQSPIQELTDPHASPRLWRDVEEGWVADVMPDLNTDDRWVSQYLRQSAIWWTETGKLDGLRFADVPNVDRNFWHDLDAELHKEYPRLQTLGAVFDADPSINSYFAGGKTVEGIDTGLDAVLDFPLAFAIQDVVNRGAPATKLVGVLRHDWMYPHPESLVTFIEEDGMGPSTNAQSLGKDKLKLALTLLLTMRGIPEIKAQSAQTPDQQEIASHVKKLLQLRREHIALREGKQYHIDAGDDFYAFSRVYLGAPSGLQGPKTERLLVVFNNAEVEKHFSLPLADTPVETAETATALFGGSPAKVADTHLMVDVPARSVVIYEVQCGCDL
jgi:glycosidase